MGITEAASRKVFLMKVRDHQGEYYYGIFYSPKETVPCEELDYLEGERFVVCRIPCYIRGENKGNPKWEADEVAVCKDTLTGALAWLKRKIEKKHLEVIVSDPEVDPYEQKN